MLPSLFISHGSPMIALEDTAYTRFLKQLAHDLPKPKAIVMVSAHYESPIQRVGTATDYRMIYDFGGFPRELSQIVYPAKGDKIVAEHILDRFASVGIDAQADPDRGIDHGVWTILHLMYPHADIPLVTLSVNPFLDASQWFKIGETLRSLKEEDILVIGSGVTLHNLRRIDWRDDAPIAPWAKAFHDWINDAVKTLDFKRLAAWKDGPHALDAVPRPEHFAPLLILAASATKGSTPILTYSEIQMGSLSYDVWRFD